MRRAQNYLALTQQCYQMILYTYFQLDDPTLLHKPKAKKVDCEIDHVGFKIGNEFVVGYGLDYQGKYRNLPFIGQLNSIN